MISLSDNSPYRLQDLRQYCLDITGVLPSFTLAGHRLVVHDMHPHLLGTGYTVREHVHSYYEGHVVLEGSATYHTGAPQSLMPGSVLLHSPHQPHIWQTAEEETCLRLLFWFSLEPVVAVPADTRWPVWPEMLWDVALLLREAQERGPGWPLRAAARVSVVISRLLQLAGWPDTRDPEENTEPRLPAQTEQFMRDNLTRPLTLGDIAGHLGVSTRTLCRQFHEPTGITVMERLLQLRMERAAQLLRDSDAKLSVIAEHVGLPDPSYFCRCFRRYYHVTPQEFRKQGE